MNFHIYVVVLCAWFLYSFIQVNRQELLDCMALNPLNLSPVSALNQSDATPPGVGDHDLRRISILSSLLVHLSLVLHPATSYLHPTSFSLWFPPFFVFSLYSSCSLKMFRFLSPHHMAEKGYLALSSYSF